MTAHRPLARTPLRHALLCAFALSTTAALGQTTPPVDPAPAQACTQAQDKTLRLAQMRVIAAEEAYEKADEQVHQGMVALQDAWLQLRQLDERANAAPPHANPLNPQWDEVARRRATADAATEARTQAAAEGERARSALEKAIARDKSCEG